MNVVTPARNPRYGVMAARINSRHLIKNTDGVIRQFTVRDRSRHHKAKCVAVCLTCNKQWATVEDLISDHPDEMILKRQQEKHVYVLWSEDPIDDGEKRDPKEKKDFAKILGMLSTEE